MTGARNAGRRCRWTLATACAGSVRETAATGTITGGTPPSYPTMARARASTARPASPRLRQPRNIAARRALAPRAGGLSVSAPVAGRGSPTPGVASSIAPGPAIAPTAGTSRATRGPAHNAARTLSRSLGRIPGAARRAVMQPAERPGSARARAAARRSSRSEGRASIAAAHATTGAKGRATAVPGELTIPCGGGVLPVRMGWVRRPPPRASSTAMNSGI